MSEDFEDRVAAAFLRNLAEDSDKTLARILLGEAGLVDPKVKEWEERARDLEAKGKE